MSEDRAITVISERPPLAPRALAGGILGADLGLFSLIVWSGSGGMGMAALMLTLIPAIGLGALVALAAWIIQQRRGSLSRLNRDLIGINSLMERRLINEEDYLMLKRRVIDDYQPQRLNVSSILKPALWTALVTSLGPLIMFVGTDPDILWALDKLVVAILLPGAFGAAVGAAGTNIIHRLQSGRHRPELPAGEPAEWQAPGTRQPLPLPKK